MTSQGNKPRFLSAYIGYSIFTGILVYFIIYPMMDHVSRLVDPMHRHIFQALKHIVSFVICFFIFRFLVTFLIVRPLMAKRSEESAEQQCPTEPSAGAYSDKAAPSGEAQP